MSAEKAKDELGWEPRFRLLDALPSVVAWYRENEGWWRRIKAGEYRAYYERVYGAAVRAADGGS